MRFIKLQYFLAFGVIGSLMPFLAVYLQKVQDLTESQIGYTLSVTSTAILITPVLLTLLADTRVDPRRLVIAIFSVSAGSLFLLHFLRGFWPTLLLLGFHSLAYTAIIPLQDGIHFSIQKNRTAVGEPALPYHRIRVWGTLGFILPSLLVFGLIRYGFTTEIILAAGMGLAFFGILNACFLPDPRPPESRRDSDRQGEQSLPTTQAARALLRPSVRRFCLAMIFAHLASAAYIGFYPLFLSKVIRIPDEWIGLIFNIGVAVEIFFMLGFGRLLNRFGLKPLMATAMFCLAVRMALLAVFPTAFVAILAQVLHGVIVLGVQVAPVMYINGQADDRFRSSIQGLYTMSVVGLSRVGGSIVAGQIADFGLIPLFWYGAVLAMVATGVFLLLFHEE